MVREKRREFVATEEYRKLLDEYVMSPRHLKLVLDIALPVGSSSTVNHIYRAFLWLLYSGMDADMTVCVRASDVDFNRMCIQIPQDFGGNVAQALYRSRVPLDQGGYPIYAEAVEDLRAACNMTEFTDPPSGVRKMRLCTRADGQYILRSFKEGESQTGAQRLHNTLKPVMQMAMKQVRKHAEMSGEEIPKWFPQNLTCKKIETSGKFYRAYEEERIGNLAWVDPHVLSAYLKWRSRPDED